MAKVQTKATATEIVVGTLLTILSGYWVAFMLFGYMVFIWLITHLHQTWTFIETNLNQLVS